MEIDCCINQRVKSFDLEPITGYLDSRLVILEECKICKRHVVVLFRQLPSGKWESIEKSNKKARDFFERIKHLIIGKTPSINDKGGSNFYLYYNHFGLIKKNYSNLAALKIGKLDDKTLPYIPEYIHHIRYYTSTAN